MIEPAAKHAAWSKRLVAAFLLSLLPVWLTGCGGVRQEVNLEGLLEQLGDPLLPARLDVPAAYMASSFDPTGGNEDYNQFVRPGPPGWVVLADLRGPGYVSRFWMTGAFSDGYRLRFYFDDEPEPRIDTTLGAFCGDEAPFLPPLAAWENLAWWSYLPLPYARRLVVMGEAPREGERLYVQINHSERLHNVRVETFPWQAERSHRAAIERARQRLAARPEIDADAQRFEARLEVEAGQSAEVVLPPGPAVVRRLELWPDPEEARSAIEREQWLRELVVRVFYEDGVASIEAPFGDFFGQPWFPAGFESLAFGGASGRFDMHLPMPYRRHARVEVRNDGQKRVTLALRAWVEELPSFDALGYLHAEWRSSGPAMTQAPHDVIAWEGAGKLAALQAAVWTEEESWNLLEGDERLWIDGLPPELVWHGTGLEDYFNGGWYYQRVLTRPTHGVTGRAPYRTSQYRVHLLDAPAWAQRFRMEWERGPYDVMDGMMETLAFVYAPEPRAVTPIPPDAGARRAGGLLENETIMMDLLGLEQLGDLIGAQQRVRAFLDRFPAHPEAALLRLRDIAYTEQLEGFSVARPLYEEFLSGVRDDRARDQARLLLGFHEREDAGLLTVYSNTPATVYLNGMPVGLGGNAAAALHFPLQVPAGRNVLAVSAPDRARPAWVLVALRTREGIVVSDPDWRWLAAPADDAWKRADFDASGWLRVGGPGVAGPPEEPYRALRADAMVDQASRATGIWPRDQVADPNKTFALRTMFEREGE